MLEQLLIHTRLPMVILDPNADLVRLGEIRPDADPLTTALVSARLTAEGGSDVRVPL